MNKPNRVRVAIATTTDFLRNPVGGKYESEELARGLSEIGFNCRILSADKLPFLVNIEQKLYRGIVKFVYKSLFKHYFSIGKAVGREVQKYSPDIVISRDIFISQHLFEHKNTLVIQDVTSKISDSKRQSKKITSQECDKMRGVEEEIYKIADHLIAKDVRLKDYLLRVVEEKKISILYPPIPDYFRPEPNAREHICKTFGLDSSKKIILFNPTRMIKQKGVEIVEKLTHLFPHVQFLVTFKTERMNFANTFDYGLIDRVKMPVIYSGVDLVIIPSIELGEHTEGISQIAIEAMLCGKPIVASDVGGLKDHGKNIELIQPNVESFSKGIQEFINGKYIADPEVAKKYAQQFYSSKYVSKYSSLINKLIKDE